jgi:hypothetical protein
MLDPEGRHLLLDALRPPAGFELDLAVGTTYTLDLHALLTAPVAFAMFDREREDGSPRLDPIAALQALRRYAERITVFTQAGDIAVPRDYRSLVVYLESSIYPVTPPNPDAIFHPKVWCIRFRRRGPEETAYRLLCPSRNLTFDRSWDTILRLEGRITDEPQHPELSAFIRSLPNLAAPVKAVPEDRHRAIDDLADESARVVWEGPGRMTVERFWPIGHDGEPAWPFTGRVDRMFVMSPFVTKSALERLLRMRNRRDTILLSRPETLDHLGFRALSRCSETLVLSPDADGAPVLVDEPVTGEASEDSDTDAGVVQTERPDTQLSGLHAKLVVADIPFGARIWTGSANLTDAAYGGNVEFLTELRGPKADYGVHATIGELQRRLGLRKLTEPYAPSTADGVPESAAERTQRRLDAARRVLGRLRYIVTCAPIDERWELTLTGTAADGRELDPGVLEGLAATIRPVTVNDVAAQAIPLEASGFSVRTRVSYPAITPFFVIRLHPIDADEVLLDTSFLINAELVGAPDDRADNVMVGLLQDRSALIRFLLLLLGNIDDAMAGFAEDGTGSWDSTGRWSTTARSDALLEPLVRAFSRDRERLDDIRSVMEELAKTETGRTILPDGWAAIWEPIEQALQAKAPR